jgi:6-phosphogluconolactonase
MAGERPDRFTLIVEPDAAAAVSRAAAVFVALVRAAAGRADRIDVALTGGSTAPAFYRELTGPLRDGVPWDRLHLWWGDDRFVRRGDPLSNVYPADHLLLGPAGAPIPEGHVHPTPCARAIDEGRDPAWAAAAYAAELEDDLSTRRGLPALDVILLGIGPDGHLLSVFPGSDAFDRSEPVVAVPAPTHIEPRVPRITLTPAVLDVAGDLLVIATGRAKAGVIASIVEGSADERALPARRAVRPGATWVLDEAAASALR